MCGKKYWKLYTLLSYRGVVYLLYMLYFKMSLYILVSRLVCVVVIVLCVLLQLSCVYRCSCFVCIVIVVLCVLW